MKTVFTAIATLAANHPDSRIRYMLKVTLNTQYDGITVIQFMFASSEGCSFIFFSINDIKDTQCVLHFVIGKIKDTI